MARPCTSRPVSEEIAPFASSSLPISTKAKPRGRPVSRSITIFTSTTLRPPSAKTSRSSPSVTLYDRFPTYSLVPISFSFVHRFGRDTALSGREFSNSMGTRANGTAKAIARHGERRRQYARGLRAGQREGENARETKHQTEAL